MAQFVSINEGHFALRVTHEPYKSGGHAEELRSKLDQQEAYFAQSQLLGFIQSGRRRSTPLNIAMAMAGAPFLSARVSCERCSSLNALAEPGHTYRMFLAIQAVLADPPGDVRESIEQMSDYLLAPKRAQLPHIAELRRSWYFLRCAIRSNRYDGRYPRGVLPFRIFAEYQRRVERQSQSDVFLASENPL
jgi:hypothetical protein